MSANDLFPTGVLQELCPLLAAGMTDIQIAVKLGVDELAVSEYISWLLGTMGLSNRPELVSLLRYRHRAASLKTPAQPCPVCRGTGQHASGNPCGTCGGAGHFARSRNAA